MHLYGFVIWSLMWSFSGVLTLNCAQRDHSTFKFSIKNNKNSTGQWFSQIQSEALGLDKDVRPLDLELEHTTLKCQETKSMLIMVNVSESLRPSPGPGYELVPGLGYYKFYTNIQTWHAACVTCNKEGAHLVIVNSMFEYSVLRTLWDRHPKVTDDWVNNFAYVGISDLEKSKTFVTIFDEPMNTTGYAKWAPGEPNHNGRCVDMERGGLLHDTNCDIKMPFFCEQEI